MAKSLVLKKFKGGSLSGTYLCKEGENTFVRKTVSSVENREYGFYRWASQLKKLQRYGKQFPDLFPKVIHMGTENGTVFFDMEFIPDAVTGYEFLAANPKREEIDIFFETLLAAMERLHSIKFPSFKGGLDLYIEQEVFGALKFCEQDESFRNFLDYSEIIFNGSEIKPFLPRAEEFQTLARACYEKPEECLTHGNITLENILYIPREKKLIFIDLYEENYIDTVYNEYSQILQSCNGNYETYNSSAESAVVRENNVNLQIKELPGVNYFNECFNKFLIQRLSPAEYTLTKLYEVSQFTRMLPFKKTVANNKLIFFYSLASHLFNLITISTK